MNSSDGEEFHERITYGENIEFNFDGPDTHEEDDCSKETLAQSDMEVLDAGIGNTDSRELHSTSLAKSPKSPCEPVGKATSRMCRASARMSRASATMCRASARIIPQSDGDSTLSGQKGTPTSREDVIEQTVPPVGPGDETVGSDLRQAGTLSTSESLLKEGTEVTEVINEESQNRIPHDALHEGTLVSSFKRPQNQESPRSQKRRNGSFDDIGERCSLHPSKDDRLPTLNQNNVSTSLLPGLLENLISRQSVISVLKCMVSATDLAFLVASTPPDLHHLLHDTYLPIADPGKGYMLAMMFGETYARALKIFRTQVIQAEPIDPPSSSVLPNLHVMLCEGQVKRVTIVSMPSHDIDLPGINKYLGEIKHELSDELELRHVLLGRQPRPNGRVDTVTVDIRNWYCECTEYQTQFAEATHEWPGDDSESFVCKILQQCPSRVLVPLPICAHILAILIKGSDKK